MKVPFPTDFENRMRGSLGNEWPAFLSAHLEESPVSIRVNPAKIELPDSEIVPWTAYGKYLESRPVFTLDPTFHAGAYYVQEASSMFLEQVLKQAVDLTQPLRVLDLCAAPGGKSTHLLSLISQDSFLVANEVIGARATVLAENIQKWGHANVVVTQNDPKDFQGLPGYFDVVVIDAPCSGEGLFRKDPQAMEEWSTANVDLCSQRQRRILHDSWSTLKKGGVLIYCTCTYNESENEDNLDWLARQKGIEPLGIKTEDSWGIQESRKGNVIGYRVYPSRSRGEGFFIAVFRKTDEEAQVKIKSRSTFNKPQKKVTDQIKEWVLDNSSFEFILQDDLILMMPSRYSTDIEMISKELSVVNKGTALATLKHEKIIPAHAFALMNGLRQENFISLALDREQALAYLRKDNLAVAENRRGFALVTFENLGLGWVNLLGSRINNLYPAGRRIRMGS